MKNNQTKIIKLTLILAISIVTLMGIVYAYDNYFELDLYRYGIYPRRWSGLIGVLTGPFIHSSVDYTHLFNNSAPAFILTWLLFYNFRTLATRVFLLTYVLTGLLVWIFGRESYHIGMSGVIYGLTSFLMISGFLTKNIRIAGISLLVIFLYGSLIWGIFPQTTNVSWEGHFFGFFIGIVLAFVYRKQLPQPKKYQYEIEEELGIEPEVEYWTTTVQPHQESPEQPTQPVYHDPIQVVYTFVPNPHKNSSNRHQEEEE